MSRIRHCATEGGTAAVAVQAALFATAGDADDMARAAGRFHCALED